MTNQYRSVPKTGHGRQTRSKGSPDMRHTVSPAKAKTEYARTTHAVTKANTKHFIKPLHA